MRGHHHSLIVLEALAAAVALAACGGGGTDSAAPPPSGPPATGITITGKAVDGALQGATACYDLNDNGACEAGEPTSAVTGADGAFSLEVTAEQAGQHRIVVDVPATAVDADTGAAVGTAFVMQAPATGTAGAHAVFVSPLTTLVQAYMDTTGAASSDAAALVQSQAQLGLSPLADFTADSSAAAAQAATVAKLVQRVSLQQAEALNAVVGQQDVSGATVTAGDVAKLSVGSIVAALPAVAALAADPALATATGADLQAALDTAAATVVAQSGLSASQAVAAIGIAKLPPDAPASDTPAPSASLLGLSFTDPDNWYYRSLQGSTADNTPNAQQQVRFFDLHQQSQSSGYSSAGVVRSWGFGNAQSASGTLHWNGTKWADCPLGQRSTSTVRDAQGRSSYDFCDGFEVGASQRNGVDVSGKAIATVVSETIRTFPGQASGMPYASWGPQDLGRFGSAAFPQGAKLQYQSSTVQKTAIAYDPQSTNVVTVYSAEIAAGGDARANPSLACAVPNVVSAPVATLELLAQASPGKPCVFGKNVSGSDSSLDPNEWWSNSTASLGVLTGGAVKPEGTGNWYSTDLRLRVAFAATGNATTYYSCLSRASNGSTRNCQQVGTGTYDISTLGDARIMTFTGLPAKAQALGFTRVFIERGGKVWFGYKNAVGTASNALWLDTVAAGAVFEALGLPPLQPVTQASDFSAATAGALTSVQGVWGMADDGSALVLRFGDGGRYMLGEAGPVDTVHREQTGGEYGFVDYDPATQKLRGLPVVDSSLTSGLSHPKPGDKVTLSADLITADNDDGSEQIARLTEDAAGLTGLWALGSATDLSVVHIAFFPNGKLLLIDPQGDTENGTCSAERKGPAGAEFASWSYDAGTGTVSIFGKLYDTDGCAGIFDLGQETTTVGWVLSGDGKTATVTSQDGEVLTFYRIAVR